MLAGDYMDPITQNWLQLQCEFNPQVRRAVVLLGMAGAGEARAVAQWPAAEPVATGLRERAEALLAGAELRDSLIENGPAQQGTLVACPILAGGQCFGLVAVIIDQAGAGEETARALQWGCRWFAWLAKERKASREQDARLLGFVEVTALALKYEDFFHSVQVLVDELRERMACERVCLAMMEGGRALAAGVSGTRAGEDVRALAAPIQRAMEEAADQQATVCLTPGTADSGLVTHAHERLLKEHSFTSVCTVPMIHNGKVVGAISCEGFDSGSFDSSKLRFFEQIALFLGPVLALKHESMRGSRRWKWRLPVRGKAVAAAALAVLAALCVVPGTYEVASTASVHSDRKQLLVAAHDGYVADAMARPGDRVEAGELLARLDDGDLRLEQRRWQSKKRQLMKAYNNALGSHDRAEINIVKAQLDQAEAQLALLENQLTRTRVVAPFAGVVVAGDLTQSLGAPVKRGDLLYEIAPGEDFVLRLEVDERDVVDLELAQRGAVRLSSLPEDLLDFEISKITPVSSSLDGRHFFQVEAAFTDASQQFLSPGMTGIARVEVGSKPYIWLWFHRLVESFQLWLWRL